MDDYNVPVLVDAKTEYTKQLINILKPHLYEGIQSIYKDAYDLCRENNDSDKVLMTFQNLLSNVPKWSQEIIDNEYNRIVDQSKCDWLEDLVTAVFVSHTKILTAIRIGKKHKKINLKVPKIDNFIHKTYIQVAREFWKTPFLFDENISTTEYQRNMKYSEELISNSINETIRQQLPVKHILKEYLGNDYDEDDEEITSDITNESNLKKLVKKEIENFNSQSEDSEEKSSDINENLKKNDDSEINLDLESQESQNDKKLEEDKLDNENQTGGSKIEENKLDKEKQASGNEIEEIKLDNENKTGGDEIEEIKLDNENKTGGGEIEEIKLDNENKTGGGGEIEEIKLDNENKTNENKIEEIKLDNENKTNENKIEEIKLDNENETNENKIEAGITVIDTLSPANIANTHTHTGGDKKENKLNEIDLNNIGTKINSDTNKPIEEINLNSIKDIKQTDNLLSSNNLLDNLEIPQVDSNIDFFANDTEDFDKKKVSYENQNNVSNEVLNEFNKLNDNKVIYSNKKDRFNFFSDAEDNE